jgi:hypothetical protein
MHAGVKADDARSDYLNALAQQDKMKTCNAEATGMKGDERKTFLSGCLKKG